MFICKSFIVFFFVFFSPIRSPINNFTLTFMKFAHHSLFFQEKRKPRSKRFCVNVEQVLSDLRGAPTGLFRTARSWASTKSIVKKERSLTKKHFPESRRVNVKCIFSIFSFFRLTSNELVCSLQEVFLKQCQYSRLASAAIPVEKIYWLTNQMLACQRRGFRFGRDVCNKGGSFYYNLHYRVGKKYSSFASEEVMKLLMPLLKTERKSIFGESQQVFKYQEYLFVDCKFKRWFFYFIFWLHSIFVLKLTKNILKLNYIFLERASGGPQRRKLVDCDKVMKVLIFDYLFSWKTLCPTASGFISLYIH